MEYNVRNKVLVLFGHPAIRKSRVNRRLIEAVRRLDDVTVNELYEAYPDFDIDVEREKELLTGHEVVILQHPFYWYSTPSIFKEWQDLVLEHGWAYGKGGHALDGKLLLNAITAGGSEESYSESGSNRLSVRRLLAPLEQTAHLCGMTYLPPFVVHGTHALTDVEVERSAGDYRRLIEGLRDGRVDAARVQAMPRINADLESVLGV